MNKRTILTAIVLGSLFSFALSNYSPVMAQTSSSNGTGQALEIAPPMITLTVDPGQTITTKINIRNISGGSLVVSGEINDFVAAGEDGTPKLLMDEKSSSSNPYSIIDWVSPMPQLTLVSRQKESLPLTITVPKSAAPGGHYGVVRFTGTPPELEGTGMALSASLGSLIMLRVSGDVKEELSLIDFSVSQNGNENWFFETTPLTINQRISNTGNLHEQPSGTVTVTDMFGNKVATLGVNQVTPQGNILPDSIRLFSQNLDKSVLGNKMLFGQYTAKLDITYGEKKQRLVSTLTFWVIPVRLLAVIISIILLLFFVLRFGLKRYNRYIIRQASKINSKTKK
jgi:hypothetical protein